MTFIVLPAFLDPTQQLPLPTVSPPPQKRVSLSVVLRILYAAEFNNKAVLPSNGFWNRQQCATADNSYSTRNIDVAHRLFPVGNLIAVSAPHSNGAIPTPCQGRYVHCPHLHDSRRQIYP